MARLEEHIVDNNLHDLNHEVEFAWICMNLHESQSAHL